MMVSGRPVIEACMGMFSLPFWSFCIGFCSSVVDSLSLITFVTVVCDPLL